LKFLDEQALIDVLRKTTLHFENYNKESSTFFDNLSEEYTSRLMKAIVAFEVEVEEINNVFKLSQNRDKKSYHNIIEKLEEQDFDSKTIAEEMKKREASITNQSAQGD
jgi:transcriptional regulator